MNQVTFIQFFPNWFWQQKQAKKDLGCTLVAKVVSKFQLRAFLRDHSIVLCYYFISVKINIYISTVY